MRFINKTVRPLWLWRTLDCLNAISYTEFTMLKAHPTRSSRWETDEAHPHPAYVRRYFESPVLSVIAMKFIDTLQCLGHSTS